MVDSKNRRGRIQNKPRASCNIRKEVLEIQKDGGRSREHRKSSR